MAQRVGSTLGNSTNGEIRRIDCVEPKRQYELYQNIGVRLTNLSVEPTARVYPTNWFAVRGSHRTGASGAPRVSVLELF